MTTNLNHLGLKNAACGVALLALAGCAPQAQVAQAPPGPLAPSQARIWFYRDYEPSVTMNDANVDLNGARVVTLPASGPAVYRDVPPGHYQIAAESVGIATNQTRDIDLAPGQEAFAKVLDDPGWLGGGDKTDFHRDTYYIWLIAPAVARAQMQMTARPL